MITFTAESSFKDLATEIARLDNEIKQVDGQLKNLKKQRDEIQIGILPGKMQAEGIQTISVADIGRLSQTTIVNVSTAAGKKFELQEWLETNGYGELVGATVNSSTLKAFVTECIREGNEYPDELVNIHSFDRVTLTKK